MRILIVEDSDSIRRMLEALVSARADEVVAVGTGAEGLDRAYQTCPDVVVLDLNLPGIYNGFEVISRLKADPETRSVPVVVVSARSDEESRRKALDSGASAYFTKPFSPIALLKEIETLKVRRTSASIKAAADVRANAGASLRVPTPPPSASGPLAREPSASPRAGSEAQPHRPTDPRRRT